MPLLKGDVMSHERIEQLEIGKHVRLRSGDGRVKVDVHCSADMVGVWVGCQKENASTPQLGIVAKTGSNPYFMIYTGISATIPVALSADGIQIPGPNSNAPLHLSWEEIYARIKTPLPQG